MASSSSLSSDNTLSTRRSSLAEAASWYCAAVILILILMASVRKSSAEISDEVRGTSLLDRHCDEIYVVGEGETLNTISDKCDDPYIVERNPHIHDPDDVFPGLVIKIAPFQTPTNLRRIRV